MKSDCVDKLLGSPLDFRDAWLVACNGGLWEICCEAWRGSSRAQRELQRLQQIFSCQHSVLESALKWFLEREGLAPNTCTELISKAETLINAFLHDNGGEFASYLEERGETCSVSLQGLGVRGDKGFVVEVELKTWWGENTDYQLLPHPEIMVLPMDDAFASALGSVKSWWRESGLPPARVTWSIRRNDGQPIETLKGNSLGALLAVGIWALLTSYPVDRSITISAALSKDGKLHPVAGLLPKVRAALTQAIPTIRHLLIASAQDDELLNEVPLPENFIRKVASINEAIEFFVVQSQERESFRSRALRLLDNFRVLSKSLDWSYYQEPTVEFSGRAMKLRELADEVADGRLKVCLLTAPSGMGKTTALRFLAYSFASEPSYYNRLLPVLLQATQWRDALSKASDLTLPTVLEHLHQFPNAPTREHWARWAEQGQLVLLVDGLERVASERDFREHLEQSVKDYPASRFVFAVRSEWLRWFEDMEFPSVNLRPLTEKQARELLGKLRKVFGKPSDINSVHIPEDAPTFLVVNLASLPPPLPRQQGKLYLRLVETLLEQVPDRPLPAKQILSVLSEALERLAVRPTLDEDELYEALKRETPLAEQIWQVLIKSGLITPEDGMVRFLHPILADVMTAYRLAERWEKGEVGREVWMRMTPTRTVLVAGLLSPTRVQSFWDWLAKQVNSDPQRWSEAAAQCYHECEVAPLNLANLIYNRWLNSFRRGDKLLPVWSRSLQTLPVHILKSMMDSISKNLDSPSLTDRNCAVEFLKLVSPKLPLSENLLRKLAQSVLRDNYGMLLLESVATIFSHEIQKPLLSLFVDQVLARLKHHAFEAKVRAVEALKELVAVMPTELRVRVLNTLKDCLINEQDSRVKSTLQKSIAYFSQPHS